MPHGTSNLVSDIAHETQRMIESWPELGLYGEMRGGRSEK